jgi:hypothetical protein
MFNVTLLGYLAGVGSGDMFDPTRTINGGVKHLRPVPPTYIGGFHISSG